MSKQRLSIILDPAGVDEASETISQWLKEEGIGQRDITRIRLSLEEILYNILNQTEEAISAEVTYFHRFGGRSLRVRYGGKRFDPRKPADNEMEEFTAALLARTGILPVWRWRFGKNEVSLTVTTRKKHAELLMLGCIVLAVAIGLLGQYIPQSIRTAVTDYGLTFLSTDF